MASFEAQGTITYAGGISMRYFITPNKVLHFTRIVGILIYQYVPFFINPIDDTILDQ